MKNNNTTRRDFFKKCSLSTVPILLPSFGFNSAYSFENEQSTLNSNQAVVNFVYDGLLFSPQAYLEKLGEIDQDSSIAPDFYGNGGVTKQLEEQFAKITGKEKAIYLPTGTMANQLAIKLLNGNNTKIIVPENSHIFRDEADAAQSVHQKRLIPLGANKDYFDLADLEAKVGYLQENEVFKSGLGTIVIENPIRRANGTVVPIETIEQISTYCKQNGHKLHLDGARLHLASAYTKVSIPEYASYFDTVYISLYKYLNAGGGAMLCGDAELIDQITHQIKILGGTVFQTWMNTAMASHYLEGIEDRWSQVIERTNQLISKLNKIENVQITEIENGTNIYDLKLGTEINLKQFATLLYQEHQIILGRANKDGIVKFTVNESLLSRSIEDIVAAWEQGVNRL